MGFILLHFNFFISFLSQEKGMQISFDPVEPFMRLYPSDSLSGWEHLLTNCVAPHSHYLFLSVPLFLPFYVF